MEQFQFEKLNVWQSSRQLVSFIYRLTKKFPKEEIYGLTNQLQRAIVSVPSNIAEGSGRVSVKDQLRFFEIAYGSLMESYCQLVLAKDLGYIDENELKAANEFIIKVARLLSGLRKSTESRLNNKKSIIPNL